MSQTAREYRLLKGSVEAMRQAAWDTFVHDYVNAVDADPGDARTRYRADIARIDGLRIVESDYE